jgi:OOP family OmpA-OmpF porin
MTSFAHRWSLMLLLLMVSAVPALAQDPNVDEEGCKESTLVSRMKGCGIMSCEKKDFDAFDAVFNKEGETKNLEGAVEQLVFLCPTNVSQLQIQRNVEAALKKAGYTIVFAGRHANNDHPAVTGQKGAQWITVQTSEYNVFPTYEQTAVLVKEMAQEMSASAQAMSDAIAKSGRLDVYGIQFATGQAAITPASDQVLSDLLAVLTANADWRLRIEGHTDNVGDKAANMKLSNARAAAVAAWLTGKGIQASRLSTAGLGDTQPVGDNATEDGRARNRRVVLIKQ